jgi:hypothetical protein
MKTWRTSINTLLLGLAIVILTAAVLWLAARLSQNPVLSAPANDPTQDANSSAPASNLEAQPATAEREYEIVTLLPRDAIPAIDQPQFYRVAEADREYGSDELVLGVSINGESRAYSTQLLDHHEVVNDTVGGRKIAVTW